MSGLFGKSQHNANVEPKIASLQYQTSSYGSVIPVVHGSARIPANLMWFANFIAIPHTETTQVGKGGGGGSTQVNTTWTYTADVMLGLCEGTVSSYFWCWRDKESFAGADPSGWRFTNFYGSDSQQSWGQISVDGLPDQALGYGGIAAIAQASMDLGGSATIKNHTVCVFAAPSTWVGTQVSWYRPANPVLIAQDILTNANYGMGWPATLIDAASWADAAQYCRVAYLWCSTAYTQQQAGISQLEDLLRFANCCAVWSGGKLKLIPYADQVVVSGQGSWYPNSTPLYSLTNDDYIVGNADEDPIQVTIRPLADCPNQFTVQFQNPLNEFSDEVATAEDLGDIDRYGLRTSSELRLPITDPPTARRVAQLALQRGLYVRKIYQFKLGWRYALLEPMDLVNLTDTTLGLNNETVRIISTDENPEDDTWNVVAEEWPWGAATAVAYTNPGGAGGGVNSSTAPGSVADPIIWEPPGDLTQWLPQIWCAVYGTGAAWGGCDIWASRTGGSDYARIARCFAKSRVGYLVSLSSPFIVGGAPPLQANDPTWDSNTVMTLDFSQSKGQLLGVSQADCDRLTTLSLLRHSAPVRGGGYVDEYLSYRDVTLQGLNQYELLQGMHRGLFGTDGNTSHPAGAAFVRLDDAIVKLDASRWNVGDTLYLKFQSFNQWGQVPEDLSVCRAYVYTVLGTARSGNGVSAFTGALSVTVPA